MSTPVPSTRRLAIAIGTAAASTTLAIGVTAASLLGWFRPGSSAPPAIPEPAPAASPVILVPVAPTTTQPPAPPAEVQLVMNEAHDDDRERDHHGRKHRDHEEDGDDD